MASSPEVQDLILDEITRVLRDLPTGSAGQVLSRANSVLKLAEAYAWVARPDQPHGVSPSPQ